MRGNSDKDSEVSDEELLAEEETSDIENILEVPFVEELCGGESNRDLMQRTFTKLAEAVERPLCTKKMPLLKETCLNSEVLSPSFDLTTSESESSDDDSNSSSSEAEEEEETHNQSVGLHFATPFCNVPSNCRTSEEEEEEETNETEEELVEVMSGDESMKGGWKKCGRGFVWARGLVQGSLMMRGEVDVELQENTENIFVEEQLQ